VPAKPVVRGTSGAQPGIRLGSDRHDRSVMPDRVVARPVTTNPVVVASRRTSRRGEHSRLAFRTILDFALMVAMFWVAFSANRDMIDQTKFHPDESRWLNRAYFVEDIFDPYGSAWQDYYITRGQPPLGSYVIGLGQLVQGGSLHPALVWDFYYSASNWNQIAGAMPTAEDLERGRNTSAFMGGLAVACVYLLVRLLTNPIGGVAGAFLLAWHGLSIRIGSQSLSDQTLLFTLGLVFLCAFAFMRRPNWPWAIALGIAFGLGGAAKLTPLLLSLAAVGIGMLVLLRFLVYPRSRAGRRADRSLALKLIMQPVIAFATFVAVSPYLWPNPILRTKNLFDFRVQEMESQGQILNNVAVTGIVNLFFRMSNRYNLGYDQQTSWKIFQEINERFDTNLTMIVGLDLMVAAAAIPFCVAIAIRYGLRSAHFLVVALLGAEAAMVIIGLRSDLYRYYLPIVLIMFICVGIMVGMVTGSLADLLRRVGPKRFRARAPFSLPSPSGRLARRVNRLARSDSRPRRIVRHIRPSRTPV
jgi:hypothetical protein